MNLAHKIVEAFEEEAITLNVLPGSSKRKNPSWDEKLLENVLTDVNSVTAQERMEIKVKLGLIEGHPLYIEPANSVNESYRFGWNRGLAMKVETVIRGRWFSWLSIIHKGVLNDGEKLPSCPMDSTNTSTEVQRMLDRCMQHVQSEGERVAALIDWIGYSLGISWFTRPNISERLWTKLYDEFDLSLFLLHPNDHLSHFMAEQGNQSGLNGYYPTPLSITSLINQLLGADMRHMPTQTVLEPCLGAGAMLLHTESLAPVGVDLNHLLVKAAAIQAFCYLPQLLYTPFPIIGLHYSREEARVNRYFEFNTDTRIYCGDSLIGELQAPRNIFKENSEWTDVYLNPLDLSKREVYLYEDEMRMPWNTLTSEMKLKIVAAQARELGFDCVASNPPFGNLSKFTRERLEEIQKSNVAFIQQRRERLENQSVPPHPLIDQITEEVEYKINEIGQYQLF
ncbi:hypothetical protein [Brevibacillus choshinensis]|uniref:hypothetical protein n=1 Tax=Brevibacillus choshinensis TaxID=54911 RepID=UPI002E237F26|nr:hypothetical protein [Brevibacillus choshinensis]